MTIRLSSAIKIENQRGYPTEITDHLRALLAAGATAYADIHRENFYDVVDGPRVYFIHVSPARDKVTLLATWLNQSRPANQSLPVCAV